MLLTAGRAVAVLVVVTFLTTGCNTLLNVIGYPTAGDPTVELKRAESKWLLIKNPRFGDVPSEPEYVWVEEEKMPTTLKSFVFGKSTLLAPPEVVSKYGQPPGGGRISPLQKMPYQPTEPAATAGSARPTGVTAAFARLRRLRGHDAHRHRPQRAGWPQAGEPREPAP
jgi:hypothetical protein